MEEEEGLELLKAAWDRGMYDLNSKLKAEVEGEGEGELGRGKRERERESRNPNGNVSLTSYSPIF